MGKFYYHAAITQPDSFELLHIRIAGKTSAASEMSEAFKAERLFGKISVRIGRDPSSAVSTYKKLNELNDKLFVNFSHEDEEAVAPIKTAIRVILDKKSIDGLVANLDTNQESDFCAIL